MKLTDSTAEAAKRLSTPHIINLIWVAGTLYIAMLVIMALMTRLGLSSAMISRAWWIALVVAVIALSWLGRTMTVHYFFFAGRRAKPSVTGFGGATDWVSGSTLMICAAAMPGPRNALAIALMAGILLHGLMIAAPYYRSARSTLPGYFDWRSPKGLAGLVTIPICAIVLLMIANAEFQLLIDIVGKLTRFPPELLAPFLLILVICPILFGGWFSMIAVNVVLGMWVMFSITLPTFLVGILPSRLESVTAGLAGKSHLEPLSTEAYNLFVQPYSSLGWLLLVLVIATGFAALPHTLTRLSLVSRPVSAIEHTGWVGLFAFVALSAVSLSVGLTTEGANGRLAETLRAQPAFHVLPYMALAFAAFNCLTAIIAALCSLIVRGIQRSRQRESGVMTMFSTRLLAVLIAIGLSLLPTGLFGSPAQSFLIGLYLTSACLFVPLVWSIWLPLRGRYTLVLTIVISLAGLVLMHIQENGLVITPPDHMHVAIGWISGLAVLAAGLFLGKNDPGRTDPVVFHELRGEGEGLFHR